MLPLRLTLPEVTDDALTVEGLVTYPNPANKVMSVNVSLNETCNVRVAVVNAAGATVSELHNRKLSKGTAVFTWNCGRLPSDTYFCIMNTGTKVYKKQI